MTSSDRSEGDAIMLRDARETDLRAILNLLADDPLGKHREPAVPENAGIPSEYEAAFEAIATDHRNQLVVAEIGGRIVGCFQLIFIRGLTHRGGVWATIAGVRVAQAMRGRGIGKAMMQDAIARARARGCVLARLMTDKRRSEAHRFYRALGFVSSHEGMMLHL
jgi:GNAT superfamily N-acetyltransferase